MVHLLGITLDPDELTPALWEQLPLELIREILLMVAQMGPDHARTLRLVSSDVNILVLPTLFRHVVMITPTHVAQLAATLLPKRRIYIPALRSRLHVMPRSLYSYSVATWVLVVNDKKPSLETALASVAPAFAGVSKLAITAQNLQANAFWMRCTAVHPRVLLLVHHGSPARVNFADPVFKNVTHLYTSITQGHRGTSVAALPKLTHLAVATRKDLPEDTACTIAANIYSVLGACPKLVSLVFLLDIESLDDPRYTLWETWLARCRQDRRFILLPDYRKPRAEWEALVRSPPFPYTEAYPTYPTSCIFPSGPPLQGASKTVWDRASEWRRLEHAREPLRTRLRRQAMLFAHQARQCMFPLGLDDEEWEVDLVQREDYVGPHPDDPDLRGPNTTAGFVLQFAPQG